MKAVINKILISKYWLIAISFMIVVICLHFFVNGDYELHRDEMLYFDMGRHLDFGYLTVPPVTGFLAFLTRNLFGYSVFGIRLIPALLGAATLFIIVRTVKDLGGGTWALLIASTTFLFIPGNLLIFSLFTPNAIEIFIWSLLVYLVFRMALTENPRLWIWIGVVAGIGFNTKYSIVFLVAGLFLAILLFRRYKLFLTPWFLFGLTAGLLLILPNMIWQYNHNWPVVYHMRELEKTQLANLNYINFFTDLFSLNSTLIFVWLVGLGALVFNKVNNEIRFIGAAIIIVFLLFIFMKGKAYYSMGLLPFIIAFGGYIFEKYFRPRYLFVPIMAAITVFSLFSLPYVLPVLSFKSLDKYAAKTGSWVSAPFIRWEDGKQHQVSQVYADMTGWKELAAEVAKTYNKLSPDEKRRCTIYCQRNYGYAGAIDFYGHKSNLPDAVTFLESYIFWAPDTISNGPFIYVYYNSNDMQQYFSEITETGSVENSYFRETGLKVFLCKYPKTNIKKAYAESAMSERIKFQRSN